MKKYLKEWWIVYAIGIFSGEIGKMISQGKNKLFGISLLLLLIFSCDSNPKMNEKTPL